MHQLLAHATESPQEAEEVAARLRAVGVDVEVREIGAGITVGMLEAPRRAWELWVPPEAEAAAREVVTKAVAEFEAQGKELEQELEAEALASAPPPESMPPPEPKPAKVVTRNARIAGALIVADMFLGIAHHVVWTVRADPVPVQPLNYIRWLVALIIALALWNGSRGARMLALLWVVVLGLGYGIGSLDLPPLVPLLELTQMASLLLLLLGSESKPRRWAGIGLWAATALASWFPLTLVPSRLTDDKLVGLWKRPHTEEQIAFCANGRYFVGYPVFSSDGKWERVGLYELVLINGPKNERHVYTAHPDHLSLFGNGWDRRGGASPCDEPAPR